MTTLPHLRVSPNRGGNRALLCRRVSICALAAVFCLGRARAQDDQLNKVHVAAAASTTASPTSEPKGAEAAPETGPSSLKIRPGSFIRMNVDLVLVPVTVTDPLNRLVTGLEKEDFQVFENNGEQKIASFASEDAPVSIGIIFDLSGSMTSKLVRARESILQFIKTANPAGRVLCHRLQRPAGAD